MSFLIPKLLVILISIIPTSISQPPPATNTTLVCNGIHVSYSYNGGYKIPPILPLADQKKQPYRFQSTLNVVNNGLEDLEDWRVWVGFQHGEYLVSASNAVPTQGDVSNGTIFTGFPATDLLTAIETAGDINQMQAVVQMTGTEFGIGAPDIPLPANITLVNDGFKCSAFNTSQGRGSNATSICCIKDLNATTNSTNDIVKLQPLQTGDLVIMYDVLRTYDSYYWAQVTISNYNDNSRLDNWQLSFDWMRGEFIYAMKGAYPSVLDANDCIFGGQSQYYKQLDFSVVLTCERRPTIIDLPPDRKDDDNLGKIPYCCRNGTILPPLMDSTQSMSIFQMQVYKMEPDLNKSTIHPPQNWNINGTWNYGYKCAAPAQVTPTLFPGSSGLPTQTAAVASWQVVCNLTQPPPQKKPKCCVSFSSFFNESAVPCNTCACGCNEINPSNTCNASATPLLVPYNALLRPFDNRTELAIQHAKNHHKFVPHPLPCGDNCGVSVNWHLLGDYKDSWTARITVFNWDDTSIPDWFAAVKLDKAMPGLEDVYSINGTRLPGSNDTLVVYGFEGSNYLIAEANPKNPRKDFPLPGSQQSVILFDKKKTPGIHVTKGDGFPSKVFFNGEECALPTMLPSQGSIIHEKSTAFSIILTIFVIIILRT